MFELIALVFLLTTTLMVPVSASLESLNKGLGLCLYRFVHFGKTAVPDKESPGVRHIHYNW